MNKRRGGEGRKPSKDGREGEGIRGIESKESGMEAAE